MAPFTGFRTTKRESKKSLGTKDRDEALRLLHAKNEASPSHHGKGKVSTNIYLRLIHNFAIGMNWLPCPVIPKRMKRGAKPDVTAERGATALSEAERVLPHSAGKQEYEEVIKLLKERTPR